MLDGVQKDIRENNFIGLYKAPTCSADFPHFVCRHQSCVCWAPDKRMSPLPFLAHFFLSLKPAPVRQRKAKGNTWHVTLSAWVLETPRNTKLEHTRSTGTNTWIWTPQIHAYLCKLCLAPKQEQPWGILLRKFWFLQNTLILGCRTKLYAIALRFNLMSTVFLLRASSKSALASPS